MIPKNCDLMIFVDRWASILFSIYPTQVYGLRRRARCFDLSKYSVLYTLKANTYLEEMMENKDSLEKLSAKEDIAKYTDGFDMAFVKDGHVISMANVTDQDKFYALFEDPKSKEFDAKF